MIRVIIFYFCFKLAASKERSDSHSKTIGFLKLLQSHDIISMALFLQDILLVLYKVSLKFQEEGSVVADVSLTIKTALIRIKVLSTRLHFFFEIYHYIIHLTYNYVFCNYQASCLSICLVMDYFCKNLQSLKLAMLPLMVLQQGIHGDGEINNDRSRLIDLLCNKIQIRFQDANSGIISATSFANFNVWPDDEARLEG